jgi:hypothetical protein
MNAGHSDPAFRHYKHSEPLTEGDEMLAEKISRLGVKYYENTDGKIVAKHCKKCNNAKTLDTFAKDKRGFGGVTAECKECRASHLRKKRGSKTEAYRPNVSIEVIDGLEGKECTKCKFWKALAEYTKHHIGLGGRESVCKGCRASYYEETKERQAEYGRLYHKNNPEKSVMKAHRRRARMLSLPDDFTSEQMQATYNCFGGCALTGDDSVHWDHAIPISTGWGGTTHGNMVPLRNDLNLSKHDDNLFEWFNRNKERFNLSQTRFDRLVEWLAEHNAMTASKYRDYVYECFENKRHNDDALAI